MKRIFALFAALIVLLCIYGCKSNVIEINQPVRVFYCNADIEFQSEDGLISSEIHEYYGWEEKPREFLNEYLSGPLSSDLISPFPLGARIVDLEQSGQIIDIQLNANFLRLSPSELTTACACISMTILELFDAETVNIEVISYGSENNMITMSRSNLFLSDTGENSNGG